MYTKTHKSMLKNWPLYTNTCIVSLLRDGVFKWLNASFSGNDAKAIIVVISIARQALTSEEIIDWQERYVLSTAPFNKHYITHTRTLGQQTHRKAERHTHSHISSVYYFLYLLQIFSIKQIRHNNSLFVFSHMLILRTFVEETICIYCFQAKQVDGPRHHQPFLLFLLSHIL